MFGLNLPGWAISIITAAGLPIVLQLLALFLPNKTVKTVGYAWGKFVTVFFRQKIGKNWETVEKTAQGTLSAFCEGLYEGLDFDDKT